MRAHFVAKTGPIASGAHAGEAERFYEDQASMVHLWLDRAHEFYRASMALLEKLLEENTHRNRCLKWYAERLSQEQPGDPPSSLRRSDALWDLRPRVDTSTFMLMGYCMELLIKGILAGATGYTMTAKGKLKRELKNHDLCSLLERTGVSCSSSQKVFLRFLTPFADGDARYPITTSAESSNVELEYSPNKIADEFQGLYLLLGSELVRRDRFFTKSGTLFGATAEEAAWTEDEWMRYRLFGEVPDRIMRAAHL